MAFIGIDIGGTKTSGAVVDRQGEIIGLPSVSATPAKLGRDAILKVVTDLAAGLIASTSERIEGIGVGAAGVIGADGTVTSATDLLSEWTGTPIAEILQANLELPVFVLNDVHAAALGEAIVGAGKGYGRVLVVAVGTGIGGGFVKDGVLDVGPGAISGSVGHVTVNNPEQRRCSCGQVGHVEAYSSGPSMQTIFREQAGQSLSLQEIEELYKQGDPIAIQAIDQGSELLGQALATAANILDPDCIVIGGGVANMGDLFISPIRSAYRASVMQTATTVPITTAKLGVNAAIIGSALYCDLSTKGPN